MEDPNFHLLQAFVSHRKQRDEATGRDVRVWEQSGTKVYLVSCHPKVKHARSVILASVSFQIGCYRKITLERHVVESEVLKTDSLV